MRPLRLKLNIDARRRYLIGFKTDILTTLFNRSDFGLVVFKPVFLWVPFVNERRHGG